jgi:hypothetical protein
MSHKDAECWFFDLLQFLWRIEGAKELRIKDFPLVGIYHELRCLDEEGHPREYNEYCGA